MTVGSNYATVRSPPIVELGDSFVTSPNNPDHAIFRAKNKSHVVRASEENNDYFAPPQ